MIKKIIAGMSALSILCSAGFIQSSAAEFKLGDVDKDGVITSADALEVLKNVVGITEFSEFEIKLADVDKNGNVNTLDALKILKHIVGLENLTETISDGSSDSSSIKDSSSDSSSIKDSSSDSSSIKDSSSDSSSTPDVSTVNMTWDTVNIGGGGFVSGIVTGKEVMFARTDVGGAYKFNFKTSRWEQLLADLNESERGYLSVDAMCVDPTNDNIVYMLCGCAYFTDAKTAIFKSTDGGTTWERHDVTDLIQVHGNGNGRQCGEAIAVDPNNPNIIYCGGDATAGDSGLIMSEDGGETWKSVGGYGKLGLFEYEINWPTWTQHKAKTTAEAYDKGANGVASIQILNGKVYVATSINGKANVHVADVGSDDFKVLSEKLPTNVFPSRINVGSDNNLYICYVGGMAFDGTAGGIFKVDTKDNTVTDISPVNNGFGSCITDPKDPNKLVATTCGVWSTQNWDKTGENVAYGEWLYRSTDGGKTWESVYPGKTGEYIWNPETGTGEPEQLYDFLDDGGKEWVYGKAIHWSGSLVLNPNDPTQGWVTSGNGVFRWDGIFSDSPKAVFHPDGIEEVVALDFISIPNGFNYSAIGDYDGFVHKDHDSWGIQHKPNMGSCTSISYCPQNPKVMMRTADKSTKGYYTLDGGENWIEMDCKCEAGKSAITKIGEDKYRFFRCSDSSQVYYSDDFGKTWNTSDGIKGTKTTYLLVEPTDPNIIYGYGLQYNEYWYYDPNKKEPTFEDAHYSFYISTDGGKTFTGQDICAYDQCDQSGRIAYLGKDNLVVGAGWNGMYNITDGGKTVEKMNVFYCKTVGYGCGEKTGDINALYIYGKPTESDSEGIYRSTDGGKTWVAINLHKLYGGTGNANFIVGDMNEFGTIYMSSVGTGIIVGRINK